MRVGIAVVALAAAIAGSGPALADPVVYVWRPSAGINGGKVLPQDAFSVSSPPSTDGGVDFRSQDFGRFPAPTRNVDLAAGDRLSVSVPAVFRPGDCHVLADSKDRPPAPWVSTSNSGSEGKWIVGIQAEKAGRLELTLMCVTNTGAPTETVHYEYLNLSIASP